MNFKAKFFIFVLVLSILLSITYVSAADSQSEILSGDAESDDLMVANDENIQSNPDEGEYKSFSNLTQDINDAGGIFEVNDNYKFCEDDSEESINIYRENLVINGNGHIIDGGNMSLGLSFDASNPSEDYNPMNITINNLTFRNFKDSAITAYGGNITLINVNFTGSDSEESMLVHLSESNVIMDFCNFHSNSVENLISLSNSNMIINNTDFTGNDYFTVAISAEYSKLTIENSLFSGNEMSGVAIGQNRGQLIIRKSNFNGFSSKQGGIISYKGDYFRFTDSKFINSRAEFNGGVIIAKYFPIYDENTSSYVITEDFLIERCTFSNVSSANDGGAIYFDMDSGAARIYKTLHIIDSNFTDCTSGYGGAVAIQGSRLNIENSIFINNSAIIGGALYATWCNVTVAGSAFSNNSAAKNAGAIYFDKAKLTIRMSNFTENRISEETLRTASAIYANDAIMDFSNSTFENGGISVYANFAGDSEIKIDTDDTFIVDNKDYVVYVENKGIKLNLIKDSVVIDEIPSKFDARDYNWTTPAKLQGDNYDCWAFATAASMETAIIKATGQTYDLSQNYIQKLQLKYYPVGDLRISLTGFAYSGLGHALSWMGALPMDAPYDDRGLILDADSEDERIHLQDALFIFPGNNTNELIKRAVLQYGAVSVQQILKNQPDVITDGEDISITNHEIHFVSIIGWDDNYVDDASEESVPKKGAWITKDSEYGFEYLMYDDERLLATDYCAIVPQNAAIAYIFENDIDYHVNYQTDLTGLTGFDGNYTYYSNEFTSKYSELIGAVGTYFNESGINYSFDVYVNGVKVHSQNGVSEFAGFRTIVLDRYIPVQAGDNFKVVFKNNALPYQAYSRQHYVPGMSLVSGNGSSWSDIALNNKTVCLKVYTVVDNSKIISKDLTMTVNDKSNFEVSIIGWNGQKAGAGEEVTFVINGKTYTAKTDADGIARLQITEKAGTYEITTRYLGSVVKNTVKVNAQPKPADKITLKSAKTVKVKRTAKRLVLKATLKINGKAVKGKVVKFKFKGKTYKAKTNKKGVAKVTIKKKVIKKLKKGKKYTVKITYLKKTAKTIVKVK